MMNVFQLKNVMKRNRNHQFVVQIKSTSIVVTNVYQLVKIQKVNVKRIATMDAPEVVSVTVDTLSSVPNAFD